MRHAPPAEDGDRWAEALVLRVQAAGPGLAPKLFLNSRLLSWEELNSGLKAELGRRSVWVVYVQADSNMSWQDALRAVDAVRGLQVKVILLTSTTESKQH
jgi:biopolymer transport protein ExbD